MKKILLFLILVWGIISSCKKGGSEFFNNSKCPCILYIMGKVTDKQTGMPVDSVKIQIKKNEMFGPTTVEEYYTDKDGKFAFQFLPDQSFLSSEYELWFWKEAYCPSDLKCTFIKIDKCKEYHYYDIKL